MKAKIKTLGAQALDTILPARCVITGEMVDHQGMIAPEAWKTLDFIHAPHCKKCGVPFDFEVTGIDTQSGSHCIQCIDYPPPFDSARSALKYNDSSRNLILGFKHADQLHAALAFTAWLKNAGAKMLENADALIPVPLHRWRLLRRRYNQSAIIAKQLSKETGLPVFYEGLTRNRPTPVQGHLNYHERRKNVKHAFEVREKYAEILKDKNLILIDDVYTTGSTVKECTKALKKAGANEVHILTLARVVKSDY